MSTAGSLERGRDAFARHAWRAAHLHSGASALLGGVGRDAAFIADRIVERGRRGRTTVQPLPRAYVDAGESSGGGA